jgi:uncharacterized protein YuzB (UPF0349 family)
LVLGVVLFLGMLGVSRIRCGHVDGWALGLAAAASAPFALFGIVKLVGREKGSEFSRSLVAKLIRNASAGRSNLQIQFCKTSLARLGPGVEPLLTTLSARGHDAVVRDCLTRCQECRQGLLLSMVDGIPLNSKDEKELLSNLDELTSGDS